LRNADNFRAWIQGIARMVAREGRRQPVHTPIQNAAESNALQAAGATALNAMQQDEERQRVVSAVADLPEPERLAVHAYFFHDQNADDAAAAMGISRSGFYAALDRGIKRLRQRLGGTLPATTEARHMK
jgi:RNA polymerase sigma-70 factor (ECF subfamily)